MRRALDHVAARAFGEPLDPALRVNLHFHPDRVSAGRTVLEHFAVDGTYRTQFETGTSNGGLTAHPGGDRWEWERRIFGGAYDAAPVSERPRYGALNHRRRTVGAAPRFGSCHLRLTAEALARTTFCFPDSFFAPDAFGTASRFGLAVLADDFGSIPRTDAEEAVGGGLLDDYVESHTHGAVSLSADVEALVLDPCYRGTATETQAAALDIPVEWHEGFRADLAVLRAHPDFRGAEAVDLAAEIAEDGSLDAAMIGRAAVAEIADPQELKRVWHCTARFGWHWDS